MQDKAALGQDVGFDLECDGRLVADGLEGKNWRLGEREDDCQFCVVFTAAARKVFDVVFYAVAAGDFFECPKDYKGLRGGEIVECWDCLLDNVVCHPESFIYGLRRCTVQGLHCTELLLWQI